MCTFCWRIILVQNISTSFISDLHKCQNSGKKPFRVLKYDTGGADYLGWKRNMIQYGSVQGHQESQRASKLRPTQPERSTINCGARIRAGTKMTGKGSKNAINKNKSVFMSIIFCFVRSFPFPPFHFHSLLDCSVMTERLMWAKWKKVLKNLLIKKCLLICIWIMCAHRCNWVTQLDC